MEKARKSMQWRSIFKITFDQKNQNTENDLKQSIEPPNMVAYSPQKFKRQGNFATGLTLA